MKYAIFLSALSFAVGLTQDVQAAEGTWTPKSAVFVMTNGATSNKVLSFTRQADGTLKASGKYETGGRGSGGTTDPLGSQGSLTLSTDHSLLFAVNAGSGTVSSFRVDGPKLELADVKPTEGSAPVSVAQFGNLVYVLNFAGNSNVMGFRVDDGILYPIAGSQRYLTTSNSGASSVSFSPDGEYLAVSEKLTNNIDIYPVLPNGMLGTLVTTKDQSAGLFDVGFAPQGTLVAVHGGPTTISSFSIGSSGDLTTLTGALPTLGNGSCWFAFTPDGRYVYVANSASSSLSGFSISASGLLTALPGEVAATFPTGSVDLDIAISGDGKYLYALNAGTGTIGVEAIQQDGSLKLVQILPVLGAKIGQNGIAAL